MNNSGSEPDADPAEMAGAHDGGAGDAGPGGYTRRVAIVGGGMGGLAAVRACLERGLLPTCFERDDKIGGVWRYVEGSKPYPGAAVYRNMTATTSKHMMSFSSCPFPSETPIFPSHRDIMKYMNNYANENGLVQYIRTNKNVVKLQQNETTGNWKVHYTHGKSKRRFSDTFYAVIVATGQAQMPLEPSNIADHGEFQGEVLHSSEYRTARCVANKNVLVIGSGVSAIDIACDMSTTAASILLTVTSPMQLVSRLRPNAKGLLPHDTQFTNSRFYHHYYPSSWKTPREDDIDHEALGLLDMVSSSHTPRSVVIADMLPYYVTNGRIKIKPRVRQFTHTGAVFEDGTHVNDIHCILFALGYKPSFPFLSTAVISDNPNDWELYMGVWPTGVAQPRLAVVGALPIGAGSKITSIELQTRWVADVLCGRAKLPCPEVMASEIIATNERVRRKDSKVIAKQHRLDYEAKLAKIVGCYPYFWDVLRLYGPRTAITVWMGPPFSYHYRLVGPDTCPHAAEYMFRAIAESKRMPNAGVSRGRTVSCPISTNNNDDVDSSPEQSSTSEQRPRGSRPPGLLSLLCQTLLLFALLYEIGTRLCSRPQPTQSSWSWLPSWRYFSYSD